MSIYRDPRDPSRVTVSHHADMLWHHMPKYAVCWCGYPAYDVRVWWSLYMEFPEIWGFMPTYRDPSRGISGWCHNSSIFGDPVDDELVQVGNSIYGDVRSSSSTPVDRICAHILVPFMPIYGDLWYEPGIYRCGAARPYISIYGVTNLDQLFINWISKYGVVCSCQSLTILCNLTPPDGAVFFT